MQRYKDIMPEVRGLVIKALGMWVIHYPAKFLNQNSFKYIGWVLNDINADVRLNTIELLQRV